jgi:hypothetical protein
MDPGDALHLPLVPILSQINPVHARQLYNFQLHFISLLTLFRNKFWKELIAYFLLIDTDRIEKYKNEGGYTDTGPGEHMWLLDKTRSAEKTKNDGVHTDTQRAKWFHSNPNKHYWGYADRWTDNLISSLSFFQYKKTTQKKIIWGLWCHLAVCVLSFYLCISLVIISFSVRSVS